MEQRTYKNFDLLFEGSSGEGYRTRVVGSPAGEATGQLVPPFTPLELEGLERRMTRRGRRQRRFESARMRAARELGDGLFSAVFTNDVGRCFRASLDEVERQGEGLRLRLRLSEVPELIDWPWELLHDPQTDSFLALSVWTPIVRYLDLPVAIKPIGAVPPLRVLVMISQPRSQPPLEVEEEWALLSEALAEPEAEGLISVTRLGEATLHGLQRALRDEEFHIFHFVGHGTYDPGHEDGLLVLEDEDGGERPVSGRDLGAFLRDQRSLRLVVLNSCSGATTSPVDPFAGSAQSLVLAGVPSVVAMQASISDSAAISLTGEFYSAIAHGHGVDTAVGEARRAMFGLGNDTEWATPVLYMRAPDGAIFDMSPDPHSREAGRVDGRPDPRPDRSGPRRSRRERAKDRSRNGGAPE